MQTSLRGFAAQGFASSPPQGEDQLIHLGAHQLHIRQRCACSRRECGRARRECPHSRWERRHSSRECARSWREHRRSRQKRAFLSGTRALPAGTRPCPAGTRMFPAGKWAFPAGRRTCPAGTRASPLGTCTFPAGARTAELGQGHSRREHGHSRREHGHSRREHGHSRREHGHSHLGNGHPHLGNGHSHLGYGHPHLLGSTARGILDHWFAATGQDLVTGQCLERLLQDEATVYLFAVCRLFAKATGSALSQGLGSGLRLVSACGWPLPRHLPPHMRMNTPSAADSAATEATPCCSLASSLRAEGLPFSVGRTGSGHFPQFPVAGTVQSMARARRSPRA